MVRCDVCSKTAELFSKAVKRIFDIVLSVAGLVILSPFLFWVAWRIRREDGGPVFYRGERVGLHGKPFRIFKRKFLAFSRQKGG